MKKYYIYFIIIIIAYNTGLIMFPAPLSFAIDLLNFYLLYLCFRHYQEVPKVAKPLVVFWSIFTTYLLIKIFMSENSNTTKDLFKNFRNVYPYFMFFYLAMLVTKKDFPKLFFSMTIICIAGSVLALVQSMYGIEPMFDPLKYYNVGHWPGQALPINDRFARVMLPTLYLIEMMFFVNVIKSIVQKTTWRTNVLNFIYVVPILIGYSRSQWVGILMCVVAIMILLFKYRRNNVMRIVLGVTAFSICLSIAFNVLKDTSLHVVSDIVSERIDEMVYDLNKNEGSYGSRINTVEVSLNLWEKSPVFGRDIYYPEITGLFEIADVAYTHALVTIGAFGLFMMASIFVLGLYASYVTLKQAIRKGDTQNIILSLLVLINILYYIIIQQLNQHPFVVSCLALTAGMMIAYNKKEMPERQAAIKSKPVYGTAKIKPAPQPVA